MDRCGSTRSSQLGSHQFARGQVHQGGDEEGAQEEGVEQDRGGHAEADLADDLLAGQDERAEHQDHDGGRGDNDPAGGGLAGAHGPVVVLRGGPLATSGSQASARHAARPPSTR